MSTEFEKKFGKVLASLEAMPDEEMASAIREYGAQYSEKGNGCDTLTLGDVATDVSKTQATYPVRFTIDRETIDQLSRFTRVVLEQTFHLTAIAAQVAKQFAVALADAAERADSDVSDVYVPVDDEAGMGTSVPVSADNSDFAYDMVA